MYLSWRLALRDGDHTPISGVMQHLDLSDEEAAALIKAPSSFNAPLRRGLVPPSRCGMVAAEFGSAGRSSPARAAVQLGGA
jgi:hypothetical protein